MNLQLLIEKTKLSRDQILNVYQFGSRIYGSNTENSDWDFFIVVKDDFPTEENGYIEIKANNIDANIYKKTTFLQKLQNNELQVLMCHFLPDEKIWQKKEKFNIQIYYTRLKASVLKEASRHLHSLAPKFSKEKNFYQEKKMKLQAIRDLLFGIQIVKFGKIKDYSEANEYQNSKNFEEIYDKLTMEFSNLINPKLIDKIESLSIIKFLKKFEMKEIRKYFEIDYFRHDNDDDICQFYYTKNTPDELEISKETSGIILNIKTGEIISYPTIRIFNHGLFHADRIDWKSATFSEFIEGEKLFFYNHKDTWYISSKGNTSLGYYDKYWNPLHSSKLFDSFNQFWNDNKLQIFRSQFKKCTFTFMFYSNELHSDSIVKYKENRLILIGCRNLKNLKEIEIESFSFEKISFRKCSSFGEVLKKSYHLNPIEQKGYIIKDSKFNRIKLFSPQYLALSDLISNPNMENKNFYELLFRRTNQDFLNFYPNLLEQYKEIKKKYSLICEEIQQEFDQIKKLEKKNFSKQCENSKFKVVLQKMKNLQIETVTDYLLISTQNEKYFTNEFIKK